MTVETTVQEMFDRYPLMYSTREECFDHLFCTIGNGYEWKRGQLVYRDSGDPDYDEKYEQKLNEDDYVRKRRGRASQSKKKHRGQTEARFAVCQGGNTQKRRRAQLVSAEQEDISVFENVLNSIVKK